MTISNFRATEPLYIIIVRAQNAESLLKEWARTTSCQVSIENNRMKIFEQRSLSTFQMTWAGDWEQVTIWDTWNKRHIHT
jgi:hypothetical protein